MSDTFDLTAWREGLARLSPSNPPCPGFRGDDWRLIHTNAKAFLETRGSEAASKGWTSLSLFGVDPKAGVANVSSCGALMMGAEPAEELTAEWISFGRTRYYRHAPQRGAVLVWDFGN